MPKTKLGNETKDHVAKKARVENIKCDMSARLAEEGAENRVDSPASPYAM